MAPASAEEPPQRRMITVESQPVADIEPFLAELLGTLVAVAAHPPAGRPHILPSVCPWAGCWFACCAAPPPRRPCGACSAAPACGSSARRRLPAGDLSAPRAGDGGPRGAGNTAGAAVPAGLCAAAAVADARRRPAASPPSPCKSAPWMRR